MNRKSLFEEGTFWVAIISFVCAFFCLFVGVFEAFITAMFWAVFGIFTLNYAILKNRIRNRR